MDTNDSLSVKPFLKDKLTTQQCLIVEDHVQARIWLERAVRQAFHSVTCVLAGTVKDGKEALDAAIPDIALIDLGLPDGNGVTLISLLDAERKVRKTKTTIIVSTVMNDDESIFSAIRAGADGYILKEESQTNLVVLLRGIHENKPPLSAPIAMRLLDYFKSDSLEGDPLAPRERQILQLLAKGFTVPKVAEMLGITQ